MENDGDTRRFDVLLTAAEAYPAFEREFMTAKQTIIAGFRLFDPWTKLHSDAAKVIGDDWFDLIVDTLNRGVNTTLILSDFDPVVRTDMHVYAWACVRALLAAGQTSNNPQLLHVSVSMHPARVGLLPRLLLWPRMIKELNAALSDINTKSKVEKQAYLDGAPHLRPLLKWRGDQLVAKKSLPPLVPVTHHQKLAVFDNQRLYVGGLDLNNRRYDTPAHDRDAPETWHDAQVIVDGPAAQDAATHLRSFQASTNGANPPNARQILRTLSAKRPIALPYLSPKPVLSELADAHRAHIKVAQTLIYMESQFFRDRDLAQAMADRARENPSLTCILILPAAPEDAAFYDDPGSDVAYGEHLQVTCIKIVRDAFGPRIFIGSPAQQRAAQDDTRGALHGAPIIYLHAKISIFDGRDAIISSANLNGRSFAWDTEVGITTRSKAEADHLKNRCFAHWLGDDAGSEFYDDATAANTWAAQAMDNIHLPPAQRKGFILPYDVAPAEDIASNLPGVPEEMV